MASAEDLFVLAERVLGWRWAQALFEVAGLPRGKAGRGVPVPSDFVSRLERELASSIGGASVHIPLSKVVQSDTLSLEEGMLIADETFQVISHSHEMEKKSRELHQTARKLQEANAKLHELHRQKDVCLSQVSHEVRRPMTSIRSISEILMKQRDLAEPHRGRFVWLIHQESVRLTWLLDEILDLLALEHGERDWDNAPMDTAAALERALDVSDAIARQRRIRVTRDCVAGPVMVAGHADRLCQVFINIIADTVSHNSAPEPEVMVRARRVGRHYIVEIADNGACIAREFHDSIFDKFVRIGPQDTANSALPGLGLGLNISHAIVQKLQGRIQLVDGPLPGACFRITLPLCPADQLPDQPTVAGASS